ncbi:MAG: hypothetical protein PWQ28_347 [Candidatus Woesearchaeota archaeon]|nr:hypothetical protein [Candidatus Woesearchaeota archaeon]
MSKKRIISITSIIILILVVSLIIKNKNPDTHKQERERLLAELNEADTIEECKSISEQIVKLGPECSKSFNTWSCMDLGQFYRHYMISCISSIAVRQDNQDLCSNKEINEEMCVRWAELAEFDFDEPSPECVNFVEEECLLAFISKSKENTTINIDCNSFEEEHKRDECFGLLATANLDPEICLNISNDVFQGRCMHYFAFRNNDEALCNYGDDWEIRECKETLDILRNEDVSICENIDLSYYLSSGKEGCYLAFAIFNRDSTICPDYRGTGPFIHKENVCERYAR